MSENIQHEVIPYEQPPEIVTDTVWRMMAHFGIDVHLHDDVINWQYLIREKWDQDDNQNS